MRSIPVATRRGGTSSLGDTSAWTSTSSGREPSIDGEHDAARRARRLADEARARVEHLDEPARAHLEHADLVRRAEAVLQRAQRPVGPLALALELQHAVDEVLEHARARQRALLRDVADEQRPRCRAPWPPRMIRAATSRTCPTEPGRAGELGACSVCTESMTQTSGRSASIVASTVVEVGLGEHRHLERAPGAQALGAQADLRGRLLAARRRACGAPRPRGGRAPCR